MGRRGYRGGMTPDITGSRPTNLQKAALVVAATFALVGVLGFIPGVTTDYDKMEFAGHHSGAELLGIFGVSVLHNVVHLLFGHARGSRSPAPGAGARLYLIGGGVVYLCSRSTGRSSTGTTM